MTMGDSTRRTAANDGDVEAFLESVADDRRQEDARAALELMRRVTGNEPQMWGASMVGFGHRPYTTADGKEHDWFVVGLSPRKASLTFYGLTYYDSNQDLLERLGPHTTGKGCLYVKRMDALDQDVLTELVERSWSTDWRDPSG
jgi:Domain of unknown function (DU1801)